MSSDAQNQDDGFDALLTDLPTKRDEQIQELQEQLTAVRDARKEERFVYITILVLLLDVVFFTIMPTFGGPLALLVLELLILIPLAKLMGVQEIAKLLDRVLSRVAKEVSGDKN